MLSRHMHTSPSVPWWRTLSRYHWFVFARASLAWLFDCLDQQLFILARPAATKAVLRPDLNPNVWGGYATAIFVAGWAMGGLIFGLSRKTPAEFSFFLAIPTMFAATVLDLYKNRALLHVHDFPMFAIGFVAAFLSAMWAVRGFIRFVSNHTFIAFAWYRIAFGLFVLATWYFGWVQWTAA